MHRRRVAKTATGLCPISLDTEGISAAVSGHMTTVLQLLWSRDSSLSKSQHWKI